LDGVRDLSQQIAFLKLALARLSTQYIDDEPGYVQEAVIEDAILLTSRIDALVVEMGMRELLINEAEEMNVEQGF